jgi:hypothetical protein
MNCAFVISQSDAIDWQVSPGAAGHWNTQSRVRSAAPEMAVATSSAVTPNLGRLNMGDTIAENTMR